MQSIEGKDKEDICYAGKTKCMGREFIPLATQPSLHSKASSCFVLVSLAWVLLLCPFWLSAKDQPTFCPPSKPSKAVPEPLWSCCPAALLISRLDLSKVTGTVVSLL